jgi:hypothetical protein
MRHEPENKDVQVAGKTSPFLIFRKLCRAEGEARPPWFFFGFPIYPRGGGKVENLFLGFHFSIRPRRRRCGNVGISPAVGEISKGLVERGGSLPLAFHAFHSPGISTALWLHGVFRQRANKLNLAFCIRRPASVSLIASACRFSISAVIPGFRDSVHFSNEESFS